VQANVLDQIQMYVLGEDGHRTIIPSSLGIDDPVLSSLMNSLYSAQMKYENLKSSTAENNPILVSIKNEIESLKPIILQNIELQKKELKIGTSTIAEEKGRFASLLNTIPRKERELLQISRQQSIKNSIYTFLLQKREEAALSLASTVADSRLIDKAHTSLSPVSPKTNVIYSAAFVLAIVVSVVLVAIKAILRPNVTVRREIEQLTTIPIVGEIGFKKTLNDLIVNQGNRDYVSEQFRQLRTSLNYVGNNFANKRILVTSTISGEGKSFVTANLAITFALTGKRVAMVELDLRKPKLSKIFGVNSKIGVSNYLIGAASLEEITESTQQMENLFIVSAGPLPPNPSELIMNEKLQHMLNGLNDRFDYIFIDCAPVSPVTDAYIVSPYCDVTLYIIREGITSKVAVKKLEYNSRLRGLKNLGIVYNGVKKKGLKEYGYDYGYSYSDGDKAVKSTRMLHT
jgi:capsular exopolysaccharide synthesis family protein